MSENQTTTESENIENLIKDLLLEKQKQDFEFNNKGMYGELFESETKHTDAQHEICVKVVFQVLSVDIKGETVHCPKIVENNYYIPLPCKEDYNPYIEKFNGFLAEAMKKASESLQNKNPV